MKFFSSKKEIFLWFFFFIVTFGVGYFHGSQPEVQLSYHYSDPTVIDMVHLGDQPFNPEFLSYIEKETHTLVKTISKKNYDDLRTELIINKNVVIALLPENFIEPLFKDNRIKNLENLKDLIENQIHKDFLPKKFDDKIYSLPINWYVNTFFIPKNKKIQKFHLLGNSFLRNIKTYYPQWGLTDKSEIRTHSIQDFSIKKFNKESLTELSLQQAVVFNIPYEINTQWSQLMVNSLVIPNNTPNKELSVKILTLILNEELAKRAFMTTSMGYTWKNLSFNNLSLIHNPDSLRNINLNSFSSNFSKFEEKLWH